MLNLNKLSKMNRILLFLSIVTILLSGTACSRPESSVQGIFETTIVNISSESSGKILGFYVNEGDTVAAGAILSAEERSVIRMMENRREPRGFRCLKSFEEKE